MQGKTPMLFWFYKIVFELFFPVLEDTSFESLMWISAVDLPSKRREALCLAVSEGALPNIQTVYSIVLPINMYLFHIC